MRVKCIATELSEEQKRLIGKKGNIPQYPFHIDGMYTVLGMALASNSPHGNNGITLQLLDEYGRCMFVPLCLFEVVEPRLSRYWVARKIREVDLLLWPEEFYQEFFHDDLSEGDPDTVEIFEEVVKKLENEH